MDIWLNENRRGFDYFFSNVSPWGLICKYQDIGLEEPVLTDNPSCWTVSGEQWKWVEDTKKETVFGISSISDAAAVLPRALKNQFLGLIRAASQSSGGGRIVDRGGSRTTLQLSNCCCSISTTNAFYANDLVNLKCENPQMVRDWEAWGPQAIHQLGRHILEEFPKDTRNDAFCV